jgi:hypothetical protein
MRRRPSLIPSLICLSFALLSCHNGPHVRTYTSYVDKGGMDYYDERTNEKGFVPYSNTDKFTCFDPEDLQTVLNYCGAKK